MGKSRQQLLAPLPLAVWLLLIVPTACTLPKIVVLEDSLTAEQHNDLGYIYEQKKIYDLAEKEYLLAVGKRENWPVPYFNLGNLAYTMGDYRKSEDFFRKSLAHDPGNTDAMNNLANALLRQDRFREARLLIEQALQTRHKDAYLETLKEIQRREALPPAHAGENPQKGGRRR
jgi:Flp pilus assembly protein TadD